MELRELTQEQDLILQIVWGENTIEFVTHMIESTQGKESILVFPYMHNDHPLELNISRTSGIVCNMFCDDPYNGNRVSWRNIELETIYQGKAVRYKLSVSPYNKLAQSDDRRVEERIKTSLYGNIANEEGKLVQVKINDISDSGIGFYAPNSFQALTNQITVFFSDNCNGESFSIRLTCKIVRTEKRAGTTFYGCRVMENNNDYLLYGCMRRTSKKLNASDIMVVRKE